MSVKPAPGLVPFVREHLNAMVNSTSPESLERTMTTSLAPNAEITRNGVRLTRSQYVQEMTDLHGAMGWEGTAIIDFKDKVYVDDSEIPGVPDPAVVGSHYTISFKDTERPALQVFSIVVIKNSKSENRVVTKLDQVISA